MFVVFLDNPGVVTKKSPNYIVVRAFCFCIVAIRKGIPFHVILAYIISKVAGSSTNIAAIQKQFDGFCETPFLWQDSLEGLQMISLPDTFLEGYPEIDKSKHLRLGKLIEQFVLFTLKQTENIKLLAANIQVFNGKLTIGELDALLLQNKLPIHLEIIYKFYLYDPTVEGELNRWLGPNKNDSLVQKLTKLKEKQFPLLYAPETQETLKALQVNELVFQQQTYFKAQLFVPYEQLNARYPHINNSCIKGFYVKYQNINVMANSSFYIPTKLDWLLEPFNAVEWLSFESFKRMVFEFIQAKKSPMCWVKNNDGTLQKFFVVWW